jgi:DNA-binding SARP family transcriptional activator
MRRNEVVRISELVTELWGEDAPPSALPTVQTYIYKLRKLLREDEGRSAKGALLTRPPGYLLATEDDNVDLCRFARLAEHGRAAMIQGDPARATALLSDALSLWRGAALADVTTGDLLSGHVTRLEAGRVEALELRIAADLALGRHQALISELKVLTTNHPMHEGFHAKLMLALQRCSRRFEALQVYQRLRRTLLDELSLEPSELLRELHRALLGAESSLSPAFAHAEPIAAASTGGPAPPVAVPAQLPRESRHFWGRRSALERVARVLVTPPSRTAARVVAVTGMPGVGKTALAVRAAHQIADHFPDGQLYVDLRGSARHPLPLHDALGELLLSCGVPRDRLPVSADERSSLFRTLSARRRMLIVLDDAVSAAQVGPLLPGSASCGVIVTTRAHPLPGAHAVQLEVLTVEEGVELLGQVLGRERLAQQLPDARRIVGTCGGLPLAVQAAAARLAAMPGISLAELADRLADVRTQLDELRLGDCDVPARYDSSYRRLRDWERSAFRLLSLMRTTEFSVTEVASLLGCDQGRARTLLERLVEHHLLRVEWHQARNDLRYGFHRLVRAFARQRLEHMLQAGRLLAPDRPALDRAPTP